MNKRPQRRFETEEEILRAIDKARGEADYQQRLSAELYESSKKSWKRFADFNKPSDRAVAQELEDKAKAADVKASQLIQITLKRLGERLSEFRTQRMPFLEDQSIPQ